MSDTSRGAVYVESLHHFSFWSQGWGSNFVWMKVDSSLLSGATNDLHAGLDRDEERSHNFIILNRQLSVYLSVCLSIVLSPFYMSHVDVFLWVIPNQLSLGCGQLTLNSILWIEKLQNIQFYMFHNPARKPLGTPYQLYGDTLKVTQNMLGTT